jgi:hypothetical protein
LNVAPSIHRVGNTSIVNVYLIEEAGEVTIVDLRESRPMGAPHSSRDHRNRCDADRGSRDERELRCALLGLDRSRQREVCGWWVDQRSRG